MPVMRIPLYGDFSRRDSDEDKDMRFINCFPEITEKRLYLETMESVLPGVEKVIIEPGTTQVLPYLPLGRDRASEAQR